MGIGSLLISLDFTALNAVTSTIPSAKIPSAPPAILIQ
jgi:hypothetical protein